MHIARARELKESGRMSGLNRIVVIGSLHMGQTPLLWLMTPSRQEVQKAWRQLRPTECWGVMSSRQTEQELFLKEEVMGCMKN